MAAELVRVAGSAGGGAHQLGRRRRVYLLLRACLIVVGSPARCYDELACRWVRGSATGESYT
jgi:hypothetical protein